MVNFMTSGNQFIVLSKADFDAMVTEAALARLSTMERDVPTVNAPSSTEDANKFLTRQQTADLAHVSLMTLNRWEHAGYLIPERIGKRVLYSKQQVLDTMQKGGIR